MVEKWESEVVKNAVAKWLICETGSNSKARDLKCNVTVSYEKEIQLMPSYSNAFVVDICSSKIMPKESHIWRHTNYISIHKECLWKRELNLFHLGNESIVSGFSKKDPKDLPVMKRKFEVAYFTANNELSFSKYKDILSLVSKWEILILVILPVPIL